MRSSYNDRASLVLGEPQAVYYAGQELTGYIKLVIQNPIQFSAINVTFHGEARTHWTEEEIEEYNGVRRTNKVQYNGCQECLHYTQCLYGMVLAGRGEGLIDMKSLPPGEREIPFKFVLPQDIPSSFKSERGRITYSATAYVDYLDNSMGRDELYHEFTVVAPMNLLQDDIVCPLEMHMEEVYSCWCSSRPMTIDIKCPVSGYCPGQAIPINIKIKNDSAVEVKKILFQLVKKELYRCQEPLSEFTTPEEVLSTIKTGAILSNSIKGFTCHLPVPAMIAPNMDNCDIIDIGFFLKATIKLTGCNDDLEEEALLFIGLTPIPGTPGSENYVHPLASSLPNGAPVSDPPLRADIEQIDRSNFSAYPGGRSSPYPADNMNSRPIDPLNSYPNQPPYPTESSGFTATYHFTSSYPGQNAPPGPTMGDIPPPYPNPTPPNLSSYPGQNAPPGPTIGDIPPPYPSPTPPNLSSHSTAPYPTHNSSYTQIQNSTDSNGGTISIRMTTLRTQNVGFVLPTGSPNPSGRTDNSSPFTPLMQDFSPSAPPPST